MQGGPSGHAPTEPPPGPVSAASGTYDEPPGEDDPASLYHVSVMGSEWGQRPREAMKYVGHNCWEISWSCLTNSLFDTKIFILDFDLTERYISLNMIYGRC